MRIYLLIFCSLIFFGCKNGEKEETSEIRLEVPTEQAAQTTHPPEVKESISRGAEIYNNFCATCHLGGGQGIPGTFPPLAGSDWLTEKRLETIHAVKFGLSGPITVNGQKYDNLMPAPGLTDQEVTDVLNYIAYSWGNQVKKPFSKEEVTAIKK